MTTTIICAACCAPAQARNWCSATGAGSWRFARVANVGLEDVGEVFLDEPATTTMLYFAPLKGERGEWAVAKATEVGVSDNRAAGE